MSVVVVVLFGIFFMLFFALWLASLIYWIVAIVEVARIPDHQFRAAGTEKLVWILVVVLAGIVGALVWRFVKRARGAGRRRPTARTAAGLVSRTGHRSVAMVGRRPLDRSPPQPTRGRPATLQLVDPARTTACPDRRMVVP